MERIWKNCLGTELGLLPFDPIVPISKRHIVAMDPSNPPMSGSGEALDQLMTRVLERSSFDVAVVAWDLVPAWNPEDGYCRWKETVDLYRFLAQSTDLPEIWKRQAARRFEDLQRRQTPSTRSGLPPLEFGMVLPVCMEPMFEGLLVQDEAAVRRALGLRERPRGWPSHGWADPVERRPDEAVLGPAIRALSRMRPQPTVLRAIRGDMRTNKDGWGEFLLRKLLEDNQARPVLLSHPLSRRLIELVGRT
ncbi:MAG TPA: hypothetical protein VLQ45_34625 [Thermoanaerobaculia bacterium]|nr:hypothetical protein [Thermoanaerobaculia bacterium]